MEGKGAGFGNMNKKSKRVSLKIIIRPSSIKRFPSQIQEAGSQLLRRFKVFVRVVVNVQEGRFLHNGPTVHGLFHGNSRARGFAHDCRTDERR